MSDQFFQGELATLLEYSSLLKKSRSPQAEEREAHYYGRKYCGRINRIKDLDALSETEPEGGIPQLPNKSAAR